jgi:cysteine desulfurase/selenocysteine lyase
MRKLFNQKELRQQFPILQQEVHNKPLIYFDNAATSQKPQQVIDAISDYYCQDNANVHRGIHELSERATGKYEAARHKVATFINAPAVTEVVYTRGATEAINMVAQCYVAQYFKAGDAVIISELEHHANIVPWQILSQRMGLEIRWLPVNEKGEVEITKLPSLLADGKVKLLAINWISNSLGTCNPVAEIISQCRKKEVLTLIDACQVPAHQRIDVQAIDCDFLVFSGHKMFAPTGIGILWARKALLEKFSLWQGGGDMILEVGFDGFAPNELPNRLEAGTPAIAQAIGLGSAIDWVNKLDLEASSDYEHQLLQFATEEIVKIPDIKIVGQAEHKSSVLSFVFASNFLHPSDVATLLNLDGIAVRSGHHCTMPILKKMGLPATVRASLCFFNTFDEVETFIQSLQRIQQKYG